MTDAAPENPYAHLDEAHRELQDDLDEAHRELQDAYPQLDWEGPVNAAVSRALEMGFGIGRAYEYSYPD